MPRKKDLLTGYKLVFALIGFSAIVTEIATLIERGTFAPIDFFSFFTVQTNILVVIALILSALAVAGDEHSHRDRLRAAAVVYILVVGLGFSVLLAGLEGVQFTAVWWDNVVLHYIMPAAMLADYVLDRPRQRLSFHLSLVWLLYPIAYFAYSLTRGALTGWYPYPFLDPGLRGYGAIFVTALGLLGLSVVLIWVVTKLSGDVDRTQAKGLSAI